MRRNLIDLFPALARVRFTHSWGGPLGVPRDWHAGVGLRDGVGWAGGYVGDGVGTANLAGRTGLAWAGGYVGDGVSTSNLAGRTLADLITDAGSELVTLPWVGHVSRRWEPEPLRFLGVNSGLRMMQSADRRESRSGRPSSMAKAFGRFLGG